MDTSPAPDTIDVVSDVVCPWCYIGKRQLDATLAALPPHERPVVRWHPFQLNPELPAAGVDRRQYLEQKFGGPERAEQIYARVRAAGQQAGLALALDRIERQPNTLDAHRLITWAQHTAQADASPLVEALFQAYFVDGRRIGDPDVLAAIAGESGLDAAAARTMLASDAYRFETAEADDRARGMGISGVPFFVFNRTLAVSGAQGADALTDALAQARAAA
jgi:predicted DsbA family dithiol-disulfide isomerase